MNKLNVIKTVDNNFININKIAVIRKSPTPREDKDGIYVILDDGTVICIFVGSPEETSHELALLQNQFNIIANYGDK